LQSELSQYHTVVPLDGGAPSDDKEAEQGAQHDTAWYTSFTDTDSTLTEVIIASVDMFNQSSCKPAPSSGVVTVSGC
jgi:hypothetical protein